MDTSEMFVLLGSGYFSAKFIIKWFGLRRKAWPPEQNILSVLFFAALPVIALGIILYTLQTLAAPDVVDSILFTLFYLLFGFVWIYFGITLMAVFLDISWIDDGVYLKNSGALFALAGGYIGVAIIYSGANTGDGPGWWCVLFAGGLGTAAWLILAMLASKLAHISERITIERSVGAGIRFGCYLLAAGIILGRASGGDWTSFYMTMIEFSDGWPVLPLTIFMLLIEYLYILRANTDKQFLLGSIFWGLLYVGVAVVSVKLLPPLTINQLNSVAVTLWQC